MAIHSPKACTHLRTHTSFKQASFTSLNVYSHSTNVSLLYFPTVRLAVLHPHVCINSHVKLHAKSVCMCSSVSQFFSEVLLCKDAASLQCVLLINHLIPSHLCCEIQGPPDQSNTRGRSFQLALGIKSLGGESLQTLRGTESGEDDMCLISKGCFHELT